MDDDTKKHLGETLYPLVLKRYSDADTAGKLTGMLMEAMPFADLEALLGQSEALTKVLSTAHAALQASSQETPPAAVDEQADAAAPPVPEGTAASEKSREPEHKKVSKAPSGPKELLNMIKWHPGANFADVFVDFRKRKSSGKLSKRVTGLPFVTFAFSQLEKVTDDQIEQILWKNTPLYRKADEDHSLKTINLEELGLDSPEDVKQAKIMNGIVNGQKARRSKQVAKVASGRAKFEPVAKWVDAGPTLQEFLVEQNVQASDITLRASALQIYYTGERMRRAMSSVASWADIIAQYCWSDGLSKFVVKPTDPLYADINATLYKSTESGQSGFALQLLGREYTCIFVTHRIKKHGNNWRLSFHHLETGSRVNCNLVTPDRADPESKNKPWSIELWAITNFPTPSSQHTYRLANECRSLPGNCIQYEGLPE